MVWTSCGACTSGPGAGVARLPLPHASSPRAVTASARPTVPPQQQAVEVVREFFAALNHASTTGDTGALSGLMTSTCPCRDLARAIARDFIDGKRAQGVVWTPTKVSFFGAHGRYFYVDVDYGISSYAVLGPSGSVESRYPARSDSGQIVVVQQGVGWLVADMTRYTGATR